MSDYSKMSLEDLEKLKKKLLSQEENLNNTIEEIISNIKSKKEQININNLGLNPYYKDKTSYIKVIVSGKGYYIITKIIPCGQCMGIYQYSILNTSDYLKYYDICSKSEWESAIDRLKVWFKDSSLKIENIDL